MATGSDYNVNCPIFDFGHSGGVIFPFRPCSTAAVGYMNLDGTAGSAGTQFWFKAISKIRLVSVQCIACADDQGAKGAACTVEPIIVVRRNPTTSVATGSLYSTITCDLTGDAGTIWTPGAGTTDVTLNTGDTLVVYLSTAAAGDAASTNQDGGGYSCTVVRGRQRPVTFNNQPVAG